MRSKFPGSISLIIITLLLLLLLKRSSDSCESTAQLVVDSAVGSEEGKVCLAESLLVSWLSLPPKLFVF